MLVSGFPAGPWGTNCFIVADGPGAQALIIDPGMGAADRVKAELERHQLTAAAVLLTHGHLDHTFAVFPVCDAEGVPAFIHSGDRAMLADPMIGFSRDMQAVVHQMSGGTFTWREPDDVRELADGEDLDILGLKLRVSHTPGHTPGSVVFDAPEGDDHPPLLFSGDLLFAGSIGRTDLPGGDTAAMMRSLSTVLPRYADDTVVLPGHGETTTMAQERQTNPFLTGQAML